jgi:ATP-binding cassette subfamily D (ALD) long-chain fatty acid import protein
MLSLADAGGRLMYSYKDLAELAGYTSRVYTLLSTLHELDQDHFQSVPRPASLPESEPFYDLGHVNGRLVQDWESIEFYRAPIVAPAPGNERGGELLVKDLDVRIKPGEHMLITGPNGVGKTGVARVLSGIWPVFEGVVRRPAKEDVFFLPQRPYHSVGSLRDQYVVEYVF